jgi:UDP-2,3-diacylglucosamine pyrophosphatase LpxH
MSAVSWLHLSDWHHSQDRRISFDREKKRDALLRDIEARGQISDSLAKIDFILFSGDITFSGAKAEFDQVKTELIDPIRNVVGTNVPIYCVPGNHDIDRSSIAHIAGGLKKQIVGLTTADAWQKFNDSVSDHATATELNKPLENYFEFLAGLGCKVSRSTLHSVQKIRSGGITIGLTCINTAWNSARFKLQHAEPPAGSKPWLWDYGLLRITEAQLQNAIREVGSVDLGILMMHHPLHWIDEFERAKLERILFKSCHIVIHGHEHRPNTNQISSAFGDLVFIPAGATYIGYEPTDPRYTSAYNFTTVDTEDFAGVVHHRIWADEADRWQADERFWLDGQSPFLLPKKKDYDPKLARRAIVNANKQYIEALGKRAAKSHEISIRHDEETLGGERFIRQHFKLRICLRAGPREEFVWRSGIDQMIANHPNKAVRRRAYKLKKLPANMKRVRGGNIQKHEFQWKGMIGPKEQWLEYEYEKLELPNNAFLIRVSRFTDQVKLSIKEAEGYHYEYVPIGGFPLLKPSKDKFFSVDTLESDRMILPSQGYLIQWRPEHRSRPAPKPKAAKKVRPPQNARRALHG